MTDETRGQTIKRRRLHHGIKSVRELADKSGIDREALGKAERDEGTPGTYERIEAWLDRFDEEVGDDETGAENGSDLVEFHIRGLYGVREIVVKGPVSDMSKIEAAVERLVRGAQAAEDGTGQ